MSPNMMVPRYDVSVGQTPAPHQSLADIESVGPVTTPTTDKQRLREELLKLILKNESVRKAHPTENLSEDSLAENIAPSRIEVIEQ